jgi:hypothetical protein
MTDGGLNVSEESIFGRGGGSAAIPLAFVHIFPPLL